MADEIKISTGDFDAVAGKLEDLGQQLPANQKIVLHWLLERAQAAGSMEPGHDTAGFGSFPPPISSRGTFTADRVWGVNGLSAARSIAIGGIGDSIAGGVGVGIVY